MGFQIKLFYVILTSYHRLQRSDYNKITIILNSYCTFLPQSSGEEDIGLDKTFCLKTDLENSSPVIL